VTRNRLLVIGALAAAGLVAGLLLVFLGGSSNPRVAQVGPETIRRDQLDLAVEHFRQEARAEGTPFPDESSARFRVVRNRVLGVLVYRAELAQAARRLGIRVTNIEVLRRLNASSGGEEQSTDRFQYDTVKTQLLYERIFREVTRSVRAPGTAQLAARRNAAMKRFVDRLGRETEVRYEPGYAPGP
jgi:hypothetical protein